MTPEPLATIPFPAGTPEGLAPLRDASTPTSAFAVETTPGLLPLLDPGATRTPTPSVRFFGTLEGKTLVMPVAADSFGVLS